MKETRVKLRIVSMHAAYKSRGEIVDGFLARPLSNDPTPAVVLLHGYRGLNDAHKAITRKFAKEGVVCLLPDLFSPFCLWEDGFA